MKTSTRIRKLFAPAVSVALALAIFAGSAQAATPDPGGALKALEIRSEALNEIYGLGTQDYLNALQIRSEGLNELYGLGDAATSAGTEEYLNALRIRSEGLNELYAGSETAGPREFVGGFDWADAGVGVALAFGAMLLAAAGVFTLRRRGRLA